jgi:FtsP/CotA-like multicopper oxidase with cupredoxin domain
MRKLHQIGVSLLLGGLVTGVASAQSFRVQCPTTTPLHSTPATTDNPAGGSIKCQQISGGDGLATMGDGTQTYIFSFGPLSGLNNIASGLPGTEPAKIFNTPFDPGAAPGTDASNGAVGLALDPEALPLDSSGNNPCVVSSAYPNPAPGCYTGHVDPRQIMDVGVMNGNIPAPMMAIDEDDEFFLTLTNVGMIMRPDLFEQHTVHFHGYPNASSFYDGVPDASVAINIGGSFTYYYLAPDAGTYFWHCHITPPEHLQMGMVGQLYVRPRQNRVSGISLYAGLQAQQLDLRTKCGNDILCSSPLPPANSVLHAPNKSGSPTLYAYNDGDGSTAYDVEYPIQIHGFDPSFHFVGMTFNPEQFVDMKDKYFLLNGRSYPDTVQTTTWVDPGASTGNSNFVGQPRVSNAIYTQDVDGVARPSQPLPTVINIPAGGKALLRISDLDVTEYQTLASLGIPMHVIGVNARLLRDLAGNNLAYDSNSITLAGGESIDVILDASDTTKYKVGNTFYLYTPNLDHLSNDAENFGGLMTEVHICNSVDAAKACN